MVQCVGRVARRDPGDAVAEPALVQHAQKRHPELRLFGGALQLVHGQRLVNGQAGEDLGGLAQQARQRQIASAVQSAGGQQQATGAGGSTSRYTEIHAFHKKRTLASGFPEAQHVTQAGHRQFASKPRRA